MGRAASCLDFHPAGFGQGPRADVVARKATAHHHAIDMAALDSAHTLARQNVTMTGSYIAWNNFGDRLLVDLHRRFGFLPRLMVRLVMRDRFGLFLAVIVARTLYRLADDENRRRTRQQLGDIVF